MKIIGLTGGISTGKSTVIKWFLEDGIPVLDADAIVHGLQQPGTELLRQIEEVFGGVMLNPDGSLNRQALGQLIFTDETAKETLNQLIHPLVRDALNQGIETARSKGEKIIVLDVPLLFESGFETLVDEVVVVYAPREVQLARLMERDGIDEAYAKAKIASQGCLEDKRKRAHYVLDNGGSLEGLRREYEKLKEVLKWDF
ncbi:MAG: dephospho-CoA kinase [Turicibacter sp.]|nr:dephospho-CoA kinase [Turicibacter sp.]